MKKLEHIIILLALSTGLSFAQPYDNAVGVRAGYSSGLIFKHFIDRDFAIEAQALYNKVGFQFAALYEYQFTPYAKERLHFVFGLGPYCGNWSRDAEAGAPVFALGAAFMAGGEYIFRKAPVIIGLEWKPMINIYKQFDYVIPDVGMTFKVILN
jgi:hypothetical protein